MYQPAASRNQNLWLGFQKKNKNMHDTLTDAPCTFMLVYWISTCAASLQTKHLNGCYWTDPRGRSFKFLFVTVIFNPEQHGTIWSSSKISALRLICAHNNGWRWRFFYKKRGGKKDNIEVLLVLYQKKKKALVRNKQMAHWIPNLKIKWCLKNFLTEKLNKLLPSTIHTNLE